MDRKQLPPLLAAVSLGLVFVGLACGGDGGGDQLAVGDRLRGMVLQSTDVPAGYEATSGTFSTNEEAAQGAADPGARLTTLEGWDRMLGYNVSYEPGAAAPSDTAIVGIETAASLYGSEEGANASFADAVKEARRTDWPAQYPDPSSVTVEEIERPSLAEGAFWLRITVTVDVGDDVTILADDFIIIHFGSVRGFLRILSLSDSTGNDSSLEEVERLAQIQLANIQTSVTEMS